MNPTRREFFARYARWGGLAALGAVAARLAWNGRGTCDRPDPCGACPLLSGCSLPKARATQTDAPGKPSIDG